MVWHPRNPELPLRVTFVAETNACTDKAAASEKHWFIPDSWIDLPARELKVLLELMRGKDDPSLTLGGLAARCGFSSAARLVPIFQGLVNTQILLWKRVEDGLPQHSITPPCYAQLDIYEQADWWAAANGDEGMPTIEELSSIQAESRRSNYVYFLRGMRTGLIKIGRSINPATRKKAIQLLAGEELELLSVLEEGSNNVKESLLHWRFETHRTRHPQHPGVEWFRPDPELLTFIQTTQKHSMCRASED